MGTGLDEPGGRSVAARGPRSSTQDSGSDMGGTPPIQPLSVSEGLQGLPRDNGEAEATQASSSPVVRYSQLGHCGTFCEGV